SCPAVVATSGHTTTTPDSRKQPAGTIWGILRTPTQVNVQGLLREVHAVEERLEAGVCPAS
ncbi:MAG: hypothetical protein O6850_01365, partial [Acidobacteria bacterium]|nr:hypothetical protein [Acidobacteriota bacterium]